jgi:hypothetical protein
VKNVIRPCPCPSTNERGFHTTTTSMGSLRERRMLYSSTQLVEALNHLSQHLHYCLGRILGFARPTAIGSAESARQATFSWHLILVLDATNYCIHRRTKPSSRILSFAVFGSNCAASRKQDTVGSSHNHDMYTVDLSKLVHMYAGLFTCRSELLTSLYDLTQVL